MTIREKNVATLTEELVGDWSTVRNDMSLMIKEAVDNCEYDRYDIWEEGDCFGIWIEVDDEEMEIVVRVENVGRTWYISKVE